ncbi:MAG: helix-turn-helix domain-containing protein [Candidatus Omnitrophica bacterium]|nr:helix-turn-helix domain-containing protein [Candidatus Omnitrophota bacterium]
MKNKTKLKNDFPRIMTIREVSEYLKIPVSTLYSLSKKGIIRGVKLGKCWRYLETDILALWQLKEAA